MGNPEPDPDANSGPVLVSGAAGFIGSHVCEALLRRGDRVVGLDNFDPFYDAAIKRRNVSEVARASSRFEMSETDFRDPAALRTLFDRIKPSGVIHLGAKAGVRPSIADPSAYMRTNVYGSAVILDECRRAAVSRIVVASSSSVYGNNAKVPFSEEDDVSRPISPYAASKRGCELACHAHHHLTGMPTACLRFFTVFGPRQRPDLAIHTFLRSISRGTPIRVFGDGSSSRDYTFIDDIVCGVLAAYDRIERMPTDKRFRVWNLGGNHPVSLSEMIATIERIVGKNAIIDRQAMQPGDVERTYADLSRSSEELEFQPQTEFAEGIKAQWDWMRGLGIP
jgi:UDP-glucuronate 4-epimerase